MSPQIEVLADKQALIDRALTLVVERIHQAIQVRGQCTLALAGGSTPKPLYEAIATQDLPWDKLHVFWGDERYVPADHPDSNYCMARLAWLEKVPMPAENIHPIPTDSNDPAIDAQRHNRQLQEFFQAGEMEFPALDIILLGIGDDAHTASLFPNTDAIQVCDRLVTVGNKGGEPRITLTVPLLKRGRCVIFLVAGANKQHALSQIFSDSSDADTYPAKLIQPEGELWWLLDSEAGVQFVS